MCSIAVEQTRIEAKGHVNDSANLASESLHRSASALFYRLCKEAEEVKTLTGSPKQPSATQKSFLKKKIAAVVETQRRRPSLKQAQ